MHIKKLDTYIDIQIGRGKINLVEVVAGADKRWKKIKQTTEKLFEGVTHEKEWRF